MKDLTLKLVMLVALVTGQRGQSIHLMNIQRMTQTTTEFKFVIYDLVKQSAPGRAQPELILPAYKADQRLCVYSVLLEYLNRTKPLRGLESRLFLSFIKPYKAICRDTIARWVKTVMIDAGIDPQIFKPHSTRSASSSKAFACNVPLRSILQAASWKTDCSFNKFYNKPIDKESQSYGLAILSNNI